jgi:transcriptional regulator with XRE-family HTH domain
MLVIVCSFRTSSALRSLGDMGITEKYFPSELTDIIIVASCESRNPHIATLTDSLRVSNGEDIPQRVARGRRVRELRERMGMSGEAFAERMNEGAAELDLDAAYDKAKVSKIETGVRDLSLEDVAIIERIAPRGAGGWFRVAFGREQPPPKRVESGAPKLPAREPQRPVIPRSKGKGSA